MSAPTTSIQQAKLVPILVFVVSVPFAWSALPHDLCMVGYLFISNPNLKRGLFREVFPVHPIRRIQLVILSLFYFPLSLISVSIYSQHRNEQLSLSFLFIFVFVCVCVFSHFSPLECSIRNRKLAWHSWSLKQIKMLCRWKECRRILEVFQEGWCGHKAESDEAISLVIGGNLMRVRQE